MTAVEIVSLCFIFVVLPPIVWRLLNLHFKRKKNKMIQMTGALKNLKSQLNNILNTTGINSTPTIDLKQLEAKKSKILEKFDRLTILMAKKLGVVATDMTIFDTILQKNVTVKTLPSDNLRLDTIAIGHHTLLNGVITLLVQENQIPDSDLFDRVNEIYKYYRKLPKKSVK